MLKAFECGQQLKEQLFSNLKILHTRQKGLFPAGTKCFYALLYYRVTLAAIIAITTIVLCVRVQGYLLFRAALCVTLRVCVLFKSCSVSTGVNFSLNLMHAA